MANLRQKGKPSFAIALGCLSAGCVVQRIAASTATRRARLTTDAAHVATSPSTLALDLAVRLHGFLKLVDPYLIAITNGLAIVVHEYISIFSPINRTPQSFRRAAALL